MPTAPDITVSDITALQAALAAAELARQAVEARASGAEAMHSLIATAKLNRVDPRAWLADALARIADDPASRLHELLPWNWKAAQATPDAEAA